MAWTSSSPFSPYGKPLFQSWRVPDPLAPPPGWRGAGQTQQPRPPQRVGAVSPPSGTYDPVLDAQRAAANRGLGDVLSDIETQGARLRTDYGVQQQDVTRGWARGAQDLEQQFGWGNQDLDRSLARGEQSLGTDFRYGMEDLGRTEQRGNFDLDQSLNRGLSDLGTSRTRGQEDYDRNVAMLQRQFQLLGGRQQETANAAGVLRGGALLQAATKRRENEALERQPMDTELQRFLSDNTLAGGRLREDVGTARTRLGEDVGTGRSRLSEGYNTGLSQLREDVGTGRERLGASTVAQRQRMAEDRDLSLAQLALQMAPPGAGSPLGGRAWQDLGTQATRAQRENAAFGLDVEAQRFYQAAGAGWMPPQRPRKRKR